MTSGQASRFGRFIRRAFATCAFAHRDRGSGAPSTKRLVPVGILGALLGAAVLLGAGAGSAAAVECPNEIRRTEQGVAALALPDCRAYENASPGSMPGFSANGNTVSGIRASINGDAASYSSKYPAEGAEHSGHFFLATRGPSGWSTETVVPQESPHTYGGLDCPLGVFFSPDLSKDILSYDFKPIDYSTFNKAYGEAFCEHSEEVLDPREEPGYRNLFLHDVASGSYELVSLNPEGGAPGNAQLAGASDDFGTVFFLSEAQITPEAPGVTPGKYEELGGRNLFVWSGGEVRLVTFLPDGTPVTGLPVGMDYHNQTSSYISENGATYQNAYSSDGSRVFFTSGGKLYARLNPTEAPSAIAGGVCTEPEKACTLEVDETQGPGASGGAHFEFASDDGSRVFFTSDQKLTADSTAITGEEDLYEFDVDSGVLTDLTVSVVEPADVWAVNGWSEDGSYVYFVAEAALAPGALPGSCEIYEEGNTCNLYLWHEGTITFVAAISVQDIRDFKASGISGGNPHLGQELKHHDEYGANSLRTEASPSGRFFAFISNEDIIGEGAGIYLYDAAVEQLSYVSGGTDSGFELGGIFPIVSTGGFTEARDIPGWRSNQVLDNGEVFFNSREALVAADTNEALDAYEFENGNLHLISSGTDPIASAFANANPSGSDVFFVTSSGLVSSDTDGRTNLYDARVGGGFAEPPPLPGCEGEACRGAGTNAPGAAGAGTASFQGPGNQAQQHKRDCGLTARRAQQLSREAKSLRRRAKHAGSVELATRLRRQATQLAKQGQQISKNAKRCRRANRRAGK
jgi:hypothetical protein